MRFNAVSIWIPEQVEVLAQYGFCRFSTTDVKEERKEGAIPAAGVQHTQVAP